MARLNLRRSVTTVSRAYSHDPFERVEAIGGIAADHKRWKLSQPAAIALIEAGTEEFFVQHGDVQVKLVVSKQGGQKYLKTERKNTDPDDLLNLMAEVDLAQAKKTTAGSVNAAANAVAPVRRPAGGVVRNLGGSRRQPSRLKQWLLTPQ